MPREYTHEMPQGFGPDAYIGLAAAQEVNRLAAENSQLRRQVEYYAGKLATAEQRTEGYRKLAFTDPLTQCLNVRGLAEALHTNQSPMAVLYCDVTGLKSVNDDKEFGHKGGDDALIATARALEKSVREHDIIARVGGDEFVILLLDNPTDTGAPLHAGEAKRTEHTPEERIAGAKAHISRNVEDWRRQNPLLPPEFNLAVGGAVWLEGMTPEEAVRAAEAEMYLHKREQHAVQGKHR